MTLSVPGVHDHMGHANICSDIYTAITTSERIRNCLRDYLRQVSTCGEDVSGARDCLIEAIVSLKDLILPELSAASNHDAWPLQHLSATVRDSLQSALATVSASLSEFSDLDESAASDVSEQTDDLVDQVLAVLHAEDCTVQLIVQEKGAGPVSFSSMAIVSDGPYPMAQTATHGLKLFLENENAYQLIAKLRQADVECKVVTPRALLLTDLENADRPDQIDIAMLQVQFDQPIPHLRNSDLVSDLVKGERVWIIGFPGSLDVLESYTSEPETFAATVHEVTNNGWIVVCLPPGVELPEGMSGGPVINDAGNQVAIVTGKDKNSRFWLRDVRFARERGLQAVQALDASDGKCTSTQSDCQEESTAVKIIYSALKVPQLSPCLPFTLSAEGM